MAKRTLEQKFVDTLCEMTEKTPTGRVTASALETKLGWATKGRFTRVRKALIEQGKIRAFPGGAGGSLECVTIPVTSQPLKAFLSYAHADKALAKELLKHLEPLSRIGLVQRWHDGDISVGKDWEKEIWSQLRAADIILLLITIDFINSEYCYEKELATAVERHKAKRAVIIPVIGRSCLWQNLPFSQIQAALNGRAILSQPNRDDALTQVAMEVKAAAEEMHDGRKKAA